MAYEYLFAAEESLRFTLPLMMRFVDVVARIVSGAESSMEILCVGSGD
jgi:hypothetical protein